MIVGNGLIAKKFHDFNIPGVLIFASGVSNSLETNNESFLREQSLVEATIKKHPNSLFVYFSSCSIYDSSKSTSQYVNHKLFIENLIKQKTKKYLILRVSNAVGNGGNPGLLLNYLFNSALNKKEILIQKNAKRNLIDVDDIRSIIEKIIKKNISNTTINLAYLYNFSIIDIISSIEKFTKLPLQLKFENSGQEYNINLDYAKEYFIEINKLNKDLYLEDLFRKYYSEFAAEK